MFVLRLPIFLKRFVFITSDKARSRARGIRVVTRFASVASPPFPESGHLRKSLKFVSLLEVGC